VNELTDSQLLRSYAEERSESAFAELVRRHLDFVYSAALRMVRDSHLAEDVVQGVFLALAKDASRLKNHPVLSGWLHLTTRNIASQTVRTEVRRREREQKAVAMNEPNPTQSEASWNEIAPELDEVLGELDESDRDALLLRYFERQSAREMGLKLGISEDAAQKRVNRAVDRLRELFSKRNVTIGTASLLVILSANAVQAAPAGLAVAIPAAVHTSAALTATKVIAMTTLQKTLIAATVAILAGAGIYEHKQAAKLRAETQSLRQQQAALSGQIQSLQQQRDSATNSLGMLADEISRFKASPTADELLKLQRENGLLRQQSPSNQPASTIQSLAKAMNDPAALELAQVQMREKLKNQYASLIHQMNLPPETADSLFNLIIDNDMKKKAIITQLTSGDIDVDTALQERNQGLADLNNQITALLGVAGYAQFDQFNHNSIATEAISRLNRKLGDQALNEDQTRQMQALLVAKPIEIMDEMDLFRPKESLDAYFQAIVDRGQSYLQEASAFLTPEQLAAATVIQSNLITSIRTQLTLGQQVIKKGGK